MDYSPESEQFVRRAGVIKFLLKTGMELLSTTCFAFVGKFLLTGSISFVILFFTESEQSY